MGDFPIKNGAKKGNRTLVSDSAGRCNTIIRFSHYAVREKGIEPSSLTWKASIIEPLYDSRDFVGKVGIEPDYLLCIRQMLLPSKLLTSFFL